MENKICIVCGKEYTPTYKRQQCCGRSCASTLRAKKLKALRIVKYCEVCGKKMYLPASSAQRKYCCRKCTDIGRTTKIKKVCEFCGKEYWVIKERENTSKYCSRKCSDEAKKGKPNCICTQCGKPFHMKMYSQLKYKRNLGFFCSKECLNKYKEKAYAGSGNHQYGLKGPLNASFNGMVIPKKNHKLVEQMVYCPNHPFCNKNGRVEEHRLIVEQNYQIFDEKYFVIIDNKHYLPPKISVHHKDSNHNNNNLSNLVPCTRSEHMHYHNIMRQKEKLNITAVNNKQGELLGTPEVGNQQPSNSLTTIEGSETRC